MHQLQLYTNCRNFKGWFNHHTVPFNWKWESILQHLINPASIPNFIQMDNYYPSWNTKISLWLSGCLSISFGLPLLHWNLFGIDWHIYFLDFWSVILIFVTFKWSALIFFSALLGCNVYANDLYLISYF